MGARQESGKGLGDQQLRSGSKRSESKDLLKKTRIAYHGSHSQAHILEVPENLRNSLTLSEQSSRSFMPDLGTCTASKPQTIGSIDPAL